MKKTLHRQTGVIRDGLITIARLFILETTHRNLAPIRISAPRMRRPLQVVLFMCMLTISTCASAQTKSLEECIQIALTNNPQIKNGLLEIQAADYQIREVRSALLPTTDLTGQYAYYTDLPTQYAPASAFGGPEGSYQKMVLAMNQTVSVTNTTTQNIFNKHVFTGLQAAKSVRQAAQLSEVQIREQVVYNVTSTYYSIQVLYDNLGRLNENIKSLEETVRINGVLKENELLPQNVYNRLLINLENLRNQYENQKLVYDKNVNALKYLMNLPQDEELTVTSFDYTEVIEMPQVGSIMQRPDIRLQQAQIRLSEYDKKSVAAGYFPVLVGGMTTGFTSYYDEFAPGKQINNDWIKSNYAFLTLKMNMFDGFKKKYQIKQKEVAIQKNINTLDMMKSNADKEVRDAVTNYETNVRLFQSSKTSLELADQLFTSAQSEYSNGLTSVSDLLNAQTDLTSARSNYSNALLNMKLAQLSLKKADGSLVNTFE